MENKKVVFKRDSSAVESEAEFDLTEVDVLVKTLPIDKMFATFILPGHIFRSDLCKELIRLL